MWLKDKIFICKVHSLYEDSFLVMYILWVLTNPDFLYPPLSYYTEYFHYLRTSCLHSFTPPSSRTPGNRYPFFLYRFAISRLSYGWGFDSLWKSTLILKIQKHPDLLPRVKRIPVKSQEAQDLLI